MPQCPECKGYIDTLLLITQPNTDFIITLTPDRLDLIKEPAIDDFQLHFDEYQCPLCNNIITESQSKALEFLQQG